MSKFELTQDEFLFKFYRHATKWTPKRMTILLSHISGHEFNKIPLESRKRYLSIAGF